ncbi:MAG: N-acetylmuramoyl-L-alanine amidase [Lachnospiraceae bacterium]
MNRGKKVLSLCIALVILLTAIPMVSAATFSYKYVQDGITKKYSGRQLKINVAGSNVSLTKTPALFTNDTSLFPCEEAFGKKKLKVNVAIDSENKTVTFTYYDQMVVVTVNSKNAFHNGTAFTLPVAPMEITYKKSKLTRILVPAEAIALRLGLNYHYANIDTNTAMITMTQKAGIDIKYGGTKRHYTDVQAVIHAANKTVSTAIPGLMLNNNVMVPAKATYGTSKLGSTYTYDSAKQQITLANDEHTVVMTVGSKVAVVDEKEQEMDCTPLKVKLVSNQKTYVMVPSVYASKWLGYEYSYQPSTATVDIGAINSITLPLPDGVDGSAVTVQDQDTRAFTITVAGDYVDYYINADILLPSIVTEMDVSLDESGNTALKCTTSTYRAAVKKIKQGKVQIQIMNPQEVYDKIIVLDAGHGGTDPGAIGNGLQEKDLTLKIVKYAKEYFDSDGSVKVYYSRLSDWLPSLVYRRDLAAEVNADMFISVHIDSYGTTSTGTSVLYNGTLNQTKNGLSSLEMANRYLESVVGATALTKRGISNRPNLAVLKAMVPCVLIETAFISNPSDCSKVLAKNSKLKAVGKAIYDTTIELFDEYPTGR